MLKTYFYSLLIISLCFNVKANNSYEKVLNKRKDIFEIIDISENNSISNFQTAASNIDGVIIRIGYRGYGSKGNFAKDKKFEEHYNGFNGKTKIGYYFVTQAISISEAEEEAVYVADILKGKSNDFPIYLDIEYSTEKNHNGRADKLTKQQRTEYAIAFLKKIGSLGYRAGVYTSESWYKTNLIYSEIVNSGASIWVAKFSTNTPSTNYYEAWQYTNKGEVRGINGNVDRTQVYQDLAGWNGIAKCGYINTDFNPNNNNEITDNNLNSSGDSANPKNEDSGANNLKQSSFFSIFIIFTTILIWQTHIIF